MRNMIRNVQEFNKKKLHLPLVDKTGNLLVSHIEDYLDKKSPILNYLDNKTKGSNPNRSNTKKYIEADSDKVIISNEYKVL